jgi:hypothetical protein
MANATAINSPIIQQRTDITARIKPLIAGRMVRPAALMFPLWDRMSVIHGTPAEEEYILSAGSSAANRVSSIMQFDVDLDSGDKGSRFIYPRDITGLNVYSGGPEAISGTDGERRFASSVIYEAVKAQLVMRLLEVNRFGDYFSFDDIRQLHDTDGYFSWFASLKTLEESDSFLYDRTDLARKALRAMSGGFVTVAQADGEGKDRDTAIKKILSKFPLLREEFRGTCSVFYTLYAAPGQSRAVTDIRPIVVGAVEHLLANKPIMSGVPFEQLDGTTRAQSDIVIEETGTFLRAVKRAFPNTGDWFITNPLGEARPLEHPLAGKDVFLIGGRSIPRRRYEPQEQEAYPAGRADATDAIGSVIAQKKGCTAVMPDAGTITIIQGSPTPQELDSAIKDRVSGKEYLLIDYDYASQAPPSNPSKRYPVGIKHLTYFSGDEDSLAPENIGSSADLVVLKAVYLKVLGRLLEANRRGNFFSETDLRSMLKSDAYIPWMTFMTLMKDIDHYGLESNVIAGLALGVFLVGNNNFGSNSANRSAVEQTVSMLRRVPGLAEEYLAYRDMFNARYIDPKMNDKAAVDTKQDVAYAVLRCIEQDDELAGQFWDDWNPSLRRDCNMLYREALEFIEALKSACASHPDWLINAPAAHYPAILPEVAAKTKAAVEEKTAEEPVRLNGDRILGLLTEGFSQSRDQYLAELACDALEALSAFGGREKYWLLPEVAILRTTPPEGASATETGHASILAERLAQAKAKKATEQRERLSAIKYAARHALGVQSDLARLIARRLEDGTLMEVAERNISSADVLMSSRAAQVMLSTEHICRGLSGLPKNDPATAFEVIRTIIADNLKTISVALSGGLTKGQRPVGLAAALVEFAGNVLDGKTMAAASYRGEEDEKLSLVEKKYDPELLDNISMAPIVAALALELREINGQVKPSAVEALVAAEKLLAIDEVAGCFSARRANIGYLSESFERAKKSLEERVRSGSGENMLAAASALSMLKVRNKELDAALLKILVGSSHTTAEDLRYTVSGFRALAQDRTTGAYELLNSYMRDSDNPNWLFFSAYMLSAGMESLMRLSGFDINTASAQEITAMLADAKIPTPERMTKLIIASRPYEGAAGFRNKKVNGLGQSKEKIAEVFEKANNAASVKDIIFRALCSENHELVAMAVSAASYLRENRPS